MSIKPYNIDKDRLPKGLILSGIAYVCIVAALALSILFIIPITDKIETEIQITTNGLPNQIVTKTGGELYYHVVDGDMVHQGDLLASQVWSHDPMMVNQINELMLKAVDFSNDQEAEEHFSSLSSIPWGDLQGDWEQVVLSQKQYGSLSRATSYNKLRQSIISEINSRRKTLDRLRVMTNKQIELKQILIDQIKQDSVLAATGAIAHRDVAASRAELLSYDQQIIANTIEQGRIKQEIAQRQTLLQRDQRDVKMLLANQLVELQDSYGAFVASYRALALERYIHASSTGKVTILPQVHNGQFYKENHSVGSILPMSDNPFTQVYMLVDVRRAGEITKGKKVYIDLSEYRQQEYGFLSATVTETPLTPVNGRYRVNIELDSGLTTSRGIDIPYNPMYNGTAEIILRKESLAQKIIRELTARSERWTR